LLLLARAACPLVHVVKFKGPPPSSSKSVVFPAVRRPWT
jgi:hypothetical protein